MQGDVVPLIGHVARHCTKSQVQDGVPQGSALALRVDTEEKFLSVNWLEKGSNSTSRTEQLVSARNLLEKVRTVRPNHWFLVLRVQDISDIKSIEATAVTLLVTEEPLISNEAHAGIHGIPLALATAAGLALAEKVIEVPTRVGDLPP